MKIHLVGPSPHSSTTSKYEPDAYAAKARRLGTMLTSIGYDVRLYHGPENDSIVTEHIPLVTHAEQERWFPGFDPMREVFSNYDPNLEPWQWYNSRAVHEIRKRCEPGDILALTMGSAHQPIAVGLSDSNLLWVESGIGYGGIWAPFRVFESYAWMHTRTQEDIRFFDTVIPNSYHPSEFPAGTGKGGYHLFMSRFVQRKGIQIAVDATRALGVPLYVAGPGMIERVGNTYRGIDVQVEGDHINYLGTVGPTERAKLMGDATAIWAPTLYCEPFGGVVPEAMLTGTPAITTDWGAFTEHVQDGFNGFRGRSLQDFVDAGQMVGSLDRAAIRENALSRWSTEVVKHQYDRYFKKLETLSRKGWYELRGEHAQDVDINVQQGDGATGGSGDGSGTPPAKLSVRGADRVGRGSPRKRASRVGVSGGKHPVG